MIYVDPIKEYKKRGKIIHSCHMIATDLEELHIFARIIKARRFHNDKIPHYDLNNKQRQLAIYYGAREVTSRELIIAYRLFKRKMYD